MLTHFCMDNLFFFHLNFPSIRSKCIVSAILSRAHLVAVEKFERNSVVPSSNINCQVYNDILNIYLEQIDFMNHYVKNDEKI